MTIGILQLVLGLAVVYTPAVGHGTQCRERVRGHASRRMSYLDGIGCIQPCSWWGVVRSVWRDDNKWVGPTMDLPTFCGRLKKSVP